MVTFQLTLDVDRQELFVGQHLRASALEVMVDDFHAVYFALGKLLTQLHSNVNAGLHMRMVDQ